MSRLLFALMPPMKLVVKTERINNTLTLVLSKQIVSSYDLYTHYLKTAATANELYFNQPQLPKRNKSSCLYVHIQRKWNEKIMYNLYIVIICTSNIAFRFSTGCASSGTRTGISRFLLWILKAPGAFKTSYDAQPGTGHRTLSRRSPLKPDVLGALTMCRNAGRVPWLLNCTLTSPSTVRYVKLNCISDDCSCRHPDAVKSLGALSCFVTITQHRRYAHLILALKLPQKIIEI